MSYDSLLLNNLRATVLSCGKCSCLMEYPPAARSPKCLDCVHTFCTGCLEELVFGDGIFASIVCPICHEETTVGEVGVLGLRDNLTVVEVLRSIGRTDEFHKPHFRFEKSINKSMELDENVINAKSTTNHNSTLNSNLNMTTIIEISTALLTSVFNTGNLSLENDMNCKIDFRRGENTTEIIIHGIPASVATAYRTILSRLNLLQPHQDPHFLQSPTKQYNSTEFSQNHSIYHPMEVSSSQSITNNTKFELFPTSTTDFLTPSKFQFQSQSHNNEIKASPSRNRSSSRVIIATEEDSLFSNLDPWGNLNNVSTYQPHSRFLGTSIDVQNTHNTSSLFGIEEVSKFYHESLFSSQNSHNITLHSNNNNSQLHPLLNNPNNPNSNTNTTQLMDTESICSEPSQPSLADVPVSPKVQPIDPNIGSTAEARSFPPPPPSSTPAETGTTSSSDHSYSSVVSSQEQQLQKEQQQWCQLNSASHLPKKTAAAATTTTTAIRILLECRADQIGKLIGLKGSRIRDMRTKSGAKIEVIKGSPCRIEICGDADQVAVGETLVCHALDIDPTFDRDRFESNELDVKPTASSMSSKNSKTSIPPLSNSNAEGDASLSTQTSTDSYSPRVDSQAPPPSLAMTTSTATVNPNRLSRDSSGIAAFLAEKAKSNPLVLNMDKIDTDFSLTAPMSPSKSASMVCPLYAVPFVIGKKGVTIKDIIAQSGCQISIEQPPNVAEINIFDAHASGLTATVKLRGRTAQLGYAKELIEGIIARVGVPGTTSAATPTTITTAFSKGNSADSTEELLHKQRSSDDPFVDNSDLNSLPTMQGLGSSSSTSTTAIDVFIPPDSVPLLTNAQNKSILRELRELSGANMIIEKDTFSSNPNTRIVRIWGTGPCVVCARDLLARRLGLSDVKSLCHPYTGKLEALESKLKPPLGSKSAAAAAAASLAPLIRSLSNTRTMHELKQMDSFEQDDGDGNGAGHESITMLRYKSDSFHDTEQDSLGEGVIIDEDWECPHDKVSVVIGRRGTVIREIKRRSHCLITIHNNVIQSKSNPSQEVQIFTFQGKKEQISHAKNLIDRVIEIGPIEALEMSTDCLECPHDRVAILIGVNGVTVKEIMRRTGCRITVNDLQEDRQIHMVDLVGTTQQLEAAREIILAVINSGVKVLSKTLKHP